MAYQAADLSTHATDAPEIPTLSTERLRLRSFCLGDLDDYAAMYADHAVVRYLGGGPEPWNRDPTNESVGDLGERCWRVERGC